jgi:hypothetical protein
MPTIHAVIRLPVLEPLVELGRRKPVLLLESNQIGLQLVHLLPAGLGLIRQHFLQNTYHHLAGWSLPVQLSQLLQPLSDCAF